MKGELIIEDKDECPRCGCNMFLVLPTEYRNKTKQELARMGVKAEDLATTENGFFNQRKYLNKLPKKNRCLNEKCGHIYLKNAKNHKPKGKVKVRPSRVGCDAIIESSGICTMHLGKKPLKCNDVKKCPRGFAPWPKEEGEENAD